MFAKKLLDSAREDKKRAAILVGGGVVLLLLLFLGQRLGGSKERALQQAMTSLLEAESFHTVLDFDLNLPAPVGGQQRRLVDVAVDIEGDWVRGQGENAQPQMTGDLRVETSGRGIILFADGQLRLLQDAIAFRLDDLPTILNPNGNLVEKWTYVQVPALETGNSEAVTMALRDVVAGMEYIGEEDGQWRYGRGFTEDQEQALIEVFRQSKSGNRALHVLARLLRAYQVESLDVWVDAGSKDVSAIALRLVEGEGEAVEEAATLRLSFSDYGKQVVVEEPPVELTVRPEVFGRIFGQGEVLELEQEEN